MQQIISKILVAFILLSILSACSDDFDEPLYFVGDSITARWDLPEYFPSRICENVGVSGSGITYVESLAGQFTGKTVVMMIGTNDYYRMQESGREKYASQYIDAVLGLKASQLYLYSVLPRNAAGDPDDINDNIADFNALIKEKLMDMPGVVYIDIYQSFMRGGKPNPQYYNDGVHLSPYGYEVLIKALDKEL